MKRIIFLFSFFLGLGTFPAIHIANESGLMPMNKPTIEHTSQPIKKKAYLTFDDGPSVHTLKILDILDQYDIKATFFVMAKQEDYAKIGYQEIKRRGHAIGLHTFTHNYNVIYRTKDDYFKDLHDLESFLRYKYEVDSHILRLPGGSKNRSSRPAIMHQITEELKKEGYKYYDWNVDSQDGISPNISVSKIVRSVLKEAEGQDTAIILLHDINNMKNTVIALPTIIKGLRAQGYDFEILDPTVPQMQF